MPKKIDEALKALKKEIEEQQKKGEVTAITLQGQKVMREDIERLPPPD